MMLTSDFIWSGVGLLLTLMVFSYFLGDNFLFRLATYILVGAAAGYFFVLICNQMVLPRLVAPVLEGDLLALVPIVFGLLLLGKLSPRLSAVGNIPMAYLVGVGAAVTIGGAVVGTLFGQFRASTGMFDLAAGRLQGANPVLQILEAGFILFGTLVSLVYFSFGGHGKEGQPLRRPVIVETLGWFGKIFVAVTLGALFAGVYAAAASALVERLGFIIEIVKTFLSMARIP
jgi:hypothetical protein